jgi:hypothetical protein
MMGSIIWELLIAEQSNERTANREQYNTKEVGMKPQETMKVGMEAARTAPWWAVRLWSRNYNKPAMTLQVARMPLYKPAWKSQLLNDEQYNMRTAQRWAV